MTHFERTGILDSQGRNKNAMNKMNAVTMMMKQAAKLTVLGMVALGAAQASPATFSFLSGGTNSASGVYGNQWTFGSSDPLLKVTATAWSLNTLTSDFAAAQMGRASGYGLWVCNTNEGLNCPSASHQIDNVNGWDFVLLQFSQAVDIDTITIKTYNNADLDISYWTGNTAANLSLTGVNLTELASLGLGASWLSDDWALGGTSRAAGIANTVPVNTLLVGSRILGDTNADYFKITAMSVQTVPVSDVPEPDTILLTGLALAALGLYGRRRSAKA